MSPRQLSCFYLFSFFKRDMKDLKAERETALAMEEYDTPESMNLYFIDREFKLPNLLRLGGRWDLGVADVRVEIVAGDNDNVKWHFGSEYEVDPRLIVRSGIRLGYDTQWFSGGFGARTADQRLGVDYAFAPYSDGLGSTHRFGLTIRP